MLSILKYFFKFFIPKSIKKELNKRKLKNKKIKVQSFFKLSQQRLTEILSNELDVQKGDVLFIHSSTDGLNLDFPAYELLNILLEFVSEDGTIILPTYPKENSYQFLTSGTIFNVRTTPTFTGLLNELARRHNKAIRSLHPTKSVVAIGKYADTLTNEHHISPYPFDINSPYYKLTEHNGKIIGVGVSTNYLSCVHCVDDFLKEKFPVRPYHKKLFEARCIDYAGKERIINTYAHNMLKMDFDIPSFIKKHISTEICEEIKIDGMKFFRADAKRLINKMINLAEEKITIYKKIFYKIG